MLLQDHDQNSQTLSKEGTPLIHIYSTYPTPTQFPLSSNPSTPLESRYCHEASSSLLPPGEKVTHTLFTLSLKYELLFLLLVVCEYILYQVVFCWSS